MEESFIHPGRAIEIHGLPQTLKKAKPDSLAKPALLRNSGGGSMTFLQFIFYSFLFIILFFTLYFFQQHKTLCIIIIFLKV